MLHTPSPHLRSKDVRSTSLHKKAFMSNIWKEIERLGQSLWYDNLSRAVISDGTIARMIGELGLRGITSNPSIFEKSISTGDEYDADIEQAVRDGLTTSEIYER